MARKKIETGGRGGGTGIYTDPAKAGTSYQKQQVKDSKSRAKWFRNFHRTKEKAFMTAYNDVHFLFVNLIHVADITSAGNPKDAIDALLDKAWELGAKTGNIKDLDSTQEGQFKTWVREWLTIAWDIAAQKMIRPFMSAFTESSATTTTNATIAIWTQADWDAFCSSLEQHECPDFVPRFVKLFCWYIKLSEGYEKAGLPIPPSYFLPICHVHTLTNLQAHRETAKGVAAQAMTHCRKFGIPFSKFSCDKLESREVRRQDVFMDQDLIAYFGLQAFSYCYKTGPTVTTKRQSTSLTGANLTTDYSNILCMFDDTKEMSIMMALGPVYMNGTYDATNNPYGGIVTLLATSATEYNTNVLHVKHLGTSWTTGQIGGTKYVLELFASYWTGSATLGPSWSGTEVTAQVNMDTKDWPGHKENANMCLDTGHVQGNEWNDNIVLAAKALLYGEA
jgi:hypothetical protein